MSKSGAILFLDVMREEEFYGEGLPVMQVPVDSQTTNRQLIEALRQLALQQEDLQPFKAWLPGVIQELHEVNDSSGMLDQPFCPGLRDRNVLMRVLKRRQVYAFFEVEEEEVEDEPESKLIVPNQRSREPDEVETQGLSAKEQMAALDAWMGEPIKEKKRVQRD